MKSMVFECLDMVRLAQSGKFKPGTIGISDATYTKTHFYMALPAYYFVRHKGGKTKYSPLFGPTSAFEYEELDRSRVNKYYSVNDRVRIKEPLCISYDAACDIMTGRRTIYDLSCEEVDYAVMGTATIAARRNTDPASAVRLADGPIAEASFDSRACPYGSWVSGIWQPIKNPVYLPAYMMPDKFCRFTAGVKDIHMVPIDKLSTDFLCGWILGAVKSKWHTELTKSYIGSLGIREYKLHMIGNTPAAERTAKLIGMLKRPDYNYERLSLLAHMRTILGAHKFYRCYQDSAGLVYTVCLADLQPVHIEDDDRMCHEDPAQAAWINNWCSCLLTHNLNYNRLEATDLYSSRSTRMCGESVIWSTRGHGGDLDNTSGYSTYIGGYVPSL